MISVRFLGGILGHPRGGLGLLENFREGVLGLSEGVLGVVLGCCVISVAFLGGFWGCLGHPRGCLGL